jgi:hypothetical protein
MFAYLSTSLLTQEIIGKESNAQTYLNTLKEKQLLLQAMGTSHALAIEFGLLQAAKYLGCFIPRTKALLG